MCVTIAIDVLPYILPKGNCGAKRRFSLLVFTPEEHLMSMHCATLRIHSCFRSVTRDEIMDTHLDDYFGV